MYKTKHSNAKLNQMLHLKVPGNSAVTSGSHISMYVLYWAIGGVSHMIQIFCLYSLIRETFGNTNMHKLSTYTLLLLLARNQTSESQNVCKNCLYSLAILLRFLYKDSSGKN